MTLFLRCKITYYFAQNQRFLNFISKVGRFSFPKLAEIHFQSWPIFTSKVDCLTLHPKHSKLLLRERLIQ